MKRGFLRGNANCRSHSQDSGVFARQNQECWEEMPTLRRHGIQCETRRTTQVKRLRNCDSPVHLTPFPAASGNTLQPSPQVPSAIGISVDADAVRRDVQGPPEAFLRDCRKRPQIAALGGRYVGYSAREYSRIFNDLARRHNLTPMSIDTPAPGLRDLGDTLMREPGNGKLVQDGHSAAVVT